MKNVIIATDFSDNGQDVWNYALEFFIEDTNIHLINVVVPIMESVEYTSVSAVASKELLKNAQNNLGKFLLQEEEKLAAKPHLKITANAMLGPVAPTLINEAERIDADLLLVGSSGLGKKNIERFLGSVSADVVQNSKVATMVIPPGYVFKPIDNVVYASDLSTSDAYAIWKITKLISPHSAVIQCLHVSEKDTDKNRAKLEEFGRFIHESNPGIETKFYNEMSSEIEETISEFADNHDAELIGMHQSSKNFWSKLFGRSHSKKMTYSLRKPLLVLKNV